MIAFQGDNSTITNEALYVYAGNREMIDKSTLALMTALFKRYDHTHAKTGYKTICTIQFFDNVCAISKVTRANLESEYVQKSRWGDRFTDIQRVSVYRKPKHPTQK
ncbi:24682_t:CDS:2 [Dentiscutata erythropus]|uniref:24682_t:CDS:1 n=1 Tax=Dentiscutata erythropus TaxID=1348616 RepID=A0A9N9HF22_9GLOM|nr:24682_t:CDS:2 [Dentiscutata erythropus]